MFALKAKLLKGMHYGLKLHEIDGVNDNLRITWESPVRNGADDGDGDGDGLTHKANAMHH